MGCATAAGRWRGHRGRAAHGRSDGRKKARHAGRNGYSRRCSKARRSAGRGAAARWNTGRARTRTGAGKTAAAATMAREGCTAVCTDSATRTTATPCIGRSPRSPDVPVRLAKSAVRSSSSSKRNPVLHGGHVATDGRQRTTHRDGRTVRLIKSCAGRSSFRAALFAISSALRSGETALPFLLGPMFTFEGLRNAVTKFEKRRRSRAPWHSHDHHQAYISTVDTAKMTVTVPPVALPSGPVGAGGSLCSHGPCTKGAAVPPVCASAEQVMIAPDDP